MDDYWGNLFIPTRHEMTDTLYLVYKTEERRIKMVTFSTRSVCDMWLTYEVVGPEYMDDDIYCLVSEQIRRSSKRYITVIAVPCHVNTMNVLRAFTHESLLIGYMALDFETYLETDSASLKEHTPKTIVRYEGIYTKEIYEKLQIRGPRQGRLRQALCCKRKEEDGGST